eukprot:TRINITY_DN7180_c0_g1_i1.p1 TRINITY_DN7180_c0_g1~~TRINITY_DN7180_c0_g1_i1.p1  ORF type:complete len:182 (+),score=49.25 TRINITY_DN7180_c0_g1_i1:92-637(+)
MSNSINESFQSYAKNFTDKEGKLWQGGAGRNPPPDAPHLVGTTPEIESLRPKSPPPKGQQQQPANSVSQPAANSTNKKSSATSPSHPQNSQASPASAITPGPGTTQEIQTTNASVTVQTLPMSEMPKNTMLTAAIEQRPLTAHSSTSRLSNMGSRFGLDVDNGMEEKVLDSGAVVTMESQK